ncbi:MAG TPA: CHASE3 domain-containing protein [Chitinophagaceae bacterium]
MLLSGRLKVKTGYFAAFLLLLVSYLFIFITLQQLFQQTNWVERTGVVINTLESLSSSINEAESAARGYILLNDADHRHTFDTTTGKIDMLLKRVETITSDNPVQQKNSDTLKSLMQEKLGGIYKGILQFEAAGHKLTDSMKTAGEIGKNLMTGIRTMINKMETEERGLLQLRKERQSTTSVSIKIITITSLIIAFLLSIYSFTTYNRESREKLKADEQTNLYRHQLENKVTELQVANSELEELRSLEKFIATGRIARTIAHEIRNPLTNIVLAADQIKDKPSTTEEEILLLNMINRNATRINQMISELLTSTKFAQLQYTKTNIATLLDETLELAKDRIELKHVQVIKNYADPGCDVVVDGEKMKIAFLNVIVNAIEAMESEKGVLEIQTLTTGNRCKIDIRDNGHGMNEETIQKLFDPYFTNKAGGNGLGLTNTQNIILNHKGNISVKSRLAQGSTFSITLNIT